MKSIDSSRKGFIWGSNNRGSNQPPTIVHIIAGLNLGGAEMTLCKLLSTAELSCFRHCVVSLSDKGKLGRDLESLGIPVHAAGWQRGRVGIRPIIAFHKLMRRLRPDLIQGWMYHGNLAAVFAVLPVWRRVPVLWNIRHTPYDLNTEKKGTAAAIRLGGRLSRIPRRIIYNAETSADLHAKLGYRKVSQVVIPNGFDLDRFKPDPAQRKILRNELRLKDSTLLVGLVARYHPVKDHRLFLRAAGLLAGEFPQLHFVLVGPAGDNALEELREWIKEEGLLGRVHLLGERRDVPSVMAGLDVVASSSATEAFPNVIGEAMACEVPCVVTDVGDCARLVGDTGVAVSCEPMALAAGLAHLIRMDPNARHQLGRSARSRIAANYSLSVTAAQYRELYSQTLSLTLGECLGSPVSNHDLG